MFNSQRLDGFELLRSIKLPVPDWQIVASLLDLDSLLLPDVDYGWTIRTCRMDGRREIGLFYLNYTKKNELIEILKYRLTTPCSREFYIVYPSWKFIFSCNVVFERDTYIIEGKYGSQKELAMGKCGPDFAISIPYGLRSQLSFYDEGSAGEVLDNLGKILQWCKRIPWEAFSTEVALKYDGRMIFYELFNLGLKNNL